MAVVLTSGQKLTLERLNKNDFEPIKQADITRLLGKMLDTESTAKQVVPKVIEYEKTKFPSKSVSDIQKYITKKLKASDDRAMFREVLSQGDYSSFPDVTKEKGKGKVNQQMFTENLPPQKITGGAKGAPSKPNGSSSELDTLLDKLLSGGDPDSVHVEAEKKDPFSGPGRTVGGDVVPSEPGQPSTGLDFSSFFKEGSKAYKENQATVDKLKKALTKQKLDDGSWFTSIASMEVPELEILQQVVNFTPLGFSKKDKDNFGKMLSRDPSEMNSISTADGLKLVGKMLVNPDSIGTLLKTRGEQLSGDAKEGLDKFWRKVTGQKPPKDEELGSLEDIVQGRRDKISKDKKRHADLDRLNGKEPTTTPDKTNQLPIKDIGGGKTAISLDDLDNLPTIDLETGEVKAGRRHKSNMTPEELLRPPPIPGFKESSATQDAFSFLRGLFIPDFSNTTDKEKALIKLKESDPSAYNKYQDAMKKYEYTKKKLALTKSSEIDLSIHKDQIKRTFDFSRSLLEKASSLGELSSDQIETIYDVSGSLEDVISGDVKITYSDLGKFQRAIFSMIPQDVLRGGGTDFADYVKDMKKALGSAFDGDSDLSDDYSYITKVATETGDLADIEEEVEEKDGDNPSEDQPEEDPPEEGSVKEVPLDTSSSKHDGNNDWASLRPRMAWGGTDSMFFRKEEEVQQANLISEAMGIEASGWGNGSDNSLYKMNLVQDAMRYSKCFAMPQPAPPDPLQLPSKFIQMTTPIMVAGYAPTNRSFEVARDPYKFGQYQNFKPAYQQTVYPSVEQKVQTGQYPYVADLRTGGQEQSVSKWDYLENLRWTHG